MRRYRPFLLLGLAGIIAFSTSTLIYRWLRAQASEKPAAEAIAKTVGVGVANFDIPRGSTLTAEMVKTVQWPEDALPAGVFREDEMASLVGRVAIVDVVQNEPVLTSKLAAADASGGVAALLDPTKRAMSVSVDEEVGVAGFVKPSDRVDLFVTVETAAGGADQQPVAITKLVLANTLVLAIGTKLVRSEKEEEATPVKVLTLEVTPDEAEKLALASTMGKFRLALRSPLSKETALTKGATIDSLLASYQGTSGVAEEGQDGATSKEPSSRVQMIKGSEVSFVSF